MSVRRRSLDEAMLAALQRLATLSSWAAVASALAFLGFAASLAGERSVAFGLGLHQALMVTAGAAVAGCVWLFAGGRKRRVLFLRKFGHRQSNSVAADAVRHGLSRHSRLFVLDDSRFEAVRIPWADRLQSLAFALPFLLFVVLIATSVRVVEGPHLYSSQAATDATRYVVRPWTSWPGAPFLWLWSAAVLTPACASLVVALRRPRRVATLSDIARVAKQVDWAGTWLAASRQAAPMMSIVQSDDAVWQEIVEMLVKRCDLIVFDLSIGSESLRWEIDTCLRLAPERTVFFTVTGNAGDWHGLRDVFAIPGDLPPRKAAGALAAHLRAHPAFGARARLGLDLAAPPDPHR